MSSTQTFRRQHAMLEQLAVQLNEKMQLVRTLDDARVCVRLLAKMTGILTLHLAAEDRALYPRMMASSDAVAAATAATFAKEMGGLADAYGEFQSKWRSSEAVLQGIEQFRREAAMVLAALSQRITRENEVLYPLAERMSASPARPSSSAGPVAQNV